jgi:magnesium-transporting ATPase (P-type)
VRTLVCVLCVRRSECFAIVFLTQCSHAFMSRSVRNSLMTSGFKDTFLGNPYLFWGTLFSIVAVIAGIYIPGVCVCVGVRVWMYAELLTHVGV